MPEGVSRVVQTDGHRMNCRQRRHISTAYLTEMRERELGIGREPQSAQSADENEKVG